MGHRSQVEKEQAIDLFALEPARQAVDTLDKRSELVYYHLEKIDAEGFHLRLSIVTGRENVVTETGIHLGEHLLSWHVVMLPSVLVRMANDPVDMLNFERMLIKGMREQYEAET